MLQPQTLKVMAMVRPSVMDEDAHCDDPHAGRPTIVDICVHMMHLLNVMACMIMRTRLTLREVPRVWAPDTQTRDVI